MTDLTAFWQFVNIVLVPIIGGLIAWNWKLEARIFDLNRNSLNRDEFHDAINGLRSDINELRKSVNNGHRP